MSTFMHIINFHFHFISFGKYWMDTIWNKKPNIDIDISHKKIMHNKSFLTFGGPYACVFVWIVDSELARRDD